jgi:tRNA A-37 threonylcarbamoyl transferase component Bud32
MAQLYPGNVLKGRYEISKLLAEGGMSRIYVGHPLQGAGMVAIKQLRQPANPSELAEDLKQFQNEYQILSSLSHPSLPRALDFFSENDEHYLVEEFVPGEELEARINKEGRLAVSDAVALAMVLLDVLEYLHKRRIIYRDLKPSNILIGRDNTLRLVDFGAARFWREGAQKDTVPLGTPGFASPEHYGRAQTDERSDIYSVGAVLHYMLTGLDPAEGQPWTFQPPHEVHADIPEALSGIVLTALQLDPTKRYASVTAMRKSLLELPFDFKNMGSGGSVGTLRSLVTLRRRLQYNNPQDYYRVLETLGLGLFGVFFFAVSIPAWFANVPLPHPLVGAWLTAYAFVHPYTNWKRYRNMRVEIYLEGMRIEDESGKHDIYWSDIQRLRLDTPGVVTARAAEISTRNQRIQIDGVWPGFPEVVAEVVNGAGLVERSAHAPWYSYVDTSEKVYERVP